MILILNSMPYIYVLRVRSRKSHRHRRRESTNAIEMNCDKRVQGKGRAAQAVYILQASQHDGDGLCGGAYSSHVLLHSSGKAKAQRNPLQNDFLRFVLPGPMTMTIFFTARSRICKNKFWNLIEPTSAHVEDVLTLLVIALSCTRSPALTAGANGH